MIEWSEWEKHGLKAPFRPPTSTTQLFALQSYKIGNSLI